MLFLIRSWPRGRGFIGPEGYFPRLVSFCGLLAAGAGPFFSRLGGPEWVVVGHAGRATAWIDRSDRGLSGRRWRLCGRTSTSPCQVSIGALSWRNSCLVRACEGGNVAVRAPGLTVDASVEARTPSSPIPIADRGNRHPAGAGGGYPFPTASRQDCLGSSSLANETHMSYAYILVYLMPFRSGLGLKFAIHPWRAGQGGGEDSFSCERNSLPQYTAQCGTT